MQKTESAFSIVVPVYNEETLLKSSLLELRSQIENKGLEEYEIILVENGSTDGTLLVLKDLSRSFSQLKILQVPYADYGKALREGIEYSRFPRIILFNVDFWDIDFLEEALSFLEDYDCVLGSKMTKGSIDKRPLSRRIISLVFNLILKLLFGYSGTDTHGIKSFRAQTIKPLISQCVTNKELFDTELIIRAQRFGLLMKELPVCIEEKRPTRYRFIDRFRSAVKDLIFLFWIIKIKPALFKQR